MLQPLKATNRCFLAICHLLFAALLLAACTAAQPPTSTPPTAMPISEPTAPRPAISEPLGEPTPTLPLPTQTTEPTAAAASPTPSITRTAGEGREAGRVLIISVDGLRPDALSETVSPHILALARAGAYTWRAQTVVPSVTLVSHASMLSGVSPSRHGLTWNSYRPTLGTIDVPTAFSVAHAAGRPVCVRRTGRRTLMVIGKTKLLHLAAPDTVDEVINLAGHGDFDVSGRAAEVLAAGFDLMFVHGN